MTTENNTTDVNQQTDDLKQVIKSIDSMSQRALSGIAAIASLSLAALESPARSLRTPNDIAAALITILDMAEMVENDINYTAETVGCQYRDLSVIRRYHAEQLLQPKTEGQAE